MSKADKMFEKFGYSKSYLDVKHGHREGEHWGEEFRNKETDIFVDFDYISKDFCIHTYDGDGIFIKLYELEEILPAIKEKLKEIEGKE